MSLTKEEVMAVGIVITLNEKGSVQSGQRAGCLLAEKGQDFTYQLNEGAE